MVAAPQPGAALLLPHGALMPAAILGVLMAGRAPTRCRSIRLTPTSGCGKSSKSPVRGRSSVQVNGAKGQSNRGIALPGSQSRSSGVQPRRDFGPRRFAGQPRLSPVHFRFHG